MKAVQQASSAVYRSREQISNAVMPALVPGLLLAIDDAVDIIVVEDAETNAPSLTEDQLLGR
jgi:hypothetical protein